MKTEMTLEMKRALLQDKKMMLLRHAEYDRGQSYWQYIIDEEYLVSLIEKDIA